MKVFDEDGNYLGEFFEGTKEKVGDAFEVSWVWGIVVLFFIAPWWTLLGLAIYLNIKVISLVIKYAFKIIWWLVRLPFCLIFNKELPEF